MLLEPEKPGKHPQPPDDLNTRELPIIELSSSGWRIHQSRYQALYFGRGGDNRFDAPAKEYGILYVGLDEFCAFRESIGRLVKYRIVTRNLLVNRQISQIEVNRPLRLVDLSGASLTKLDADGRLCTGDYKVAQRWALALRNHPNSPDGLYYRSRYDPSRYCLAIYDHLESELSVRITYDLLEDSFIERLGNILDTYEYGFIND